MAELKTQENDQSVDAFLQQVEDEKRRRDCYTVVEIMREAAGAEPRMWGDSIVGFGKYRYKYASGREGDWMLVGFSPRKDNLTLYIMAGFEQYEGLLARLGKIKHAKSCLYVKKLEDVDLEVLKELVRQSVDHMRRTNSPA